MRNRPPFKRNKSRRKAKKKISNASNDSGNKRNKRLTLLAIAVVGYSLFEWVTLGELRWPGKLLNQSSDTVEDYATRPKASWRKAADKVDAIGAAREGQTPPPADLTGRVVRVADGDTVSVLDRNKKQHKIRFFGIDSPERDQPHGQDAGRVLSKLVEDKTVNVVIVEKDDYGRTVGTVYLGDTNVNQYMVSQGYAWWYRYHAPHERHLEAAEQQARAAGKGLWADPAPIAPWDWRRGRR